jgi:hypothetical protein
MSLIDYADMEVPSFADTRPRKKRREDEPEPMVVPEPPPRVLPCGLPSRQQEEMELGMPDDPTYCFGCAYIGEHDAGAVKYEEIMGLIRILRTGVARTHPTCLAIDVARKYAAIAADVNDNLMPGEEPLPSWSAASILDHVRNHNTDAEVQQWLRQHDLQELSNVYLYYTVKKNEATGEMELDDKKAKMYLEIVKQLEVIAKTDPSTKAWYSHGSHLDPKSLTQGVLAVGQKKIISYLVNSKNRL